jgi:hypothetical protein
MTHEPLKKASTVPIAMITSTIASMTVTTLFVISTSHSFMKLTSAPLTPLPR